MQTITYRLVSQTYTFSAFRILLLFTSSFVLKSEEQQYLAGKSRTLGGI